MSSRSLDDLRLDVRPQVNAFLAACAAADLDLLITCTLRSNAEQDLLYAQGRSAPGHVVTNARAGQSAHNYGLALDIVPMVNGKPDWNGSDPVWDQIGQKGVAAGLTWLGSPGSSFREKPHFEHANWRALAGIT